MSTLRSLAKSDTAIGSVTTTEMVIIADVLNLVAGFSRSSVAKYLVPKHLRSRPLTLEMLAATFNRVSTHNDSPSQLDGQIKLAMRTSDDGDRS